MKMRIYDYEDNAVVVKLPNKPIERIDVTVLSGDETGTVHFKDGSELKFDASDYRHTDLYDGSYTVIGKDIKRWLAYRPKSGREASSDRREAFDK